MKVNLAEWCAVFGVAAMMTSPVFAGGVRYEDGDKYLKLGGRVQVQYRNIDVDEGGSIDDLFFRRLRPYIEGSAHKDWKAKWQFDLGKGELKLKDAYFKYSGFDWGNVIVGNAYVQFSREATTSSKYQQLVERTFVGDHNYGSPDRQLGVHLDGDLSEAFSWSSSLASMAHDPNNRKLDFESPADIDNGVDFQEGYGAAGRLAFHPMGMVKKSQGDFGTESFVFELAVGGFAWENDKDNLLGRLRDDDGATVFGREAADSITGLEVSLAVRGAGLSVDAQYNTFGAELVLDGVSNGLYENSETTLENYALEGGYMVLANQVEVVAGVSAQDADGYSETWNRYSFGLNYFVDKHNIKLQSTYRINENRDGKDGLDVNELFVQAQYVF